MSTLRLINITDQYPSSDGVYHLAYYHPPKSGEQDQISKYLLDFEGGQEPQTTQWIRLAALLVSQSLSFDVIVRPVSANEFAAKKPTSLEKLCVAIARKSGAKYQRTWLERTKSAHVNDFGSQSEQRPECPDSYSFSNESSDEATRILVVDDFVVNEPTLTAIAGAIRTKLPQAKILFFALGRIEENEQNSHLDVRYFTSTSSPMPTVATSDKGPVKTVTRHVHHVAKPDHAAAPAAGYHAGAPARPASVGQPAKARRGSVGSAVLFSLLGVAIISSGYIMFAGRRSATDNAFYQVPSVNVAEKDVPVVSAPVQPAKAPRKGSIDDGSQQMGVIIVPSVGLRSEHFVDAKVLRSKVRNGEKVVILKKLSSSTGPRWMQIKTAKGNVGWVWASVVREVRSRVLAAR